MGFPVCTVSDDVMVLCFPATPRAGGESLTGDAMHTVQHTYSVRLQGTEEPRESSRDPSLAVRAVQGNRLDHCAVGWLGMAPSYHVAQV